MDAIKTENLTKYYGKNIGIKNLNLTVKEGDFFGFIGPNGAGKSTTIRTLLGLIKANGGTAEVLGEKIGGKNKTVLSKIGYLPSEAQFYSGMKVSEIIEFSAKLRKKDCSAEAKRLCDCLELDTKRKVNELSLGNRKKVGIVCALQHLPDLYIMDEPTSGLDPVMQKAFYELLKERNKQGATVFLSSHVLSEVQQYCRHAAIIKNGCILAEDTVENLGGIDAKKVTVKGITVLPDIECLKGGKIDGDKLSFYYSGEIKILLKALANLNITDITIAKPDLNEVFLHYYERQEE